MHRALDAVLLDQPITTFKPAIHDPFGSLRRLLQGKLRALPNVTKAVVGVVDDTLLIQATGGDVKDISELAKKHRPNGMTIDLMFTDTSAPVVLTRKKRL